MLSINTNISSLIAQNSLTQSTNKLNQAIERMTTGAKINHAKDNAANYSISTNMTTKMGAYMVAQDNVAMGMDIIATASDTLDLISEHLQRLRDLATQASNDSYGAASLSIINAEANARVDEIRRLYTTTEYNGIALYDSLKGAGCDIESLPKVGASSFINENQKRDTSKMKPLLSAHPNQELADGVYSISTPQELKQLADMTNNGLISSGDEFVLANDIDLTMYSIAGWMPIGNTLMNGFDGTFDGNGFAITNLMTADIGASNHAYGLFGYIKGASLKNLAIIQCNINVGSGTWFAAGLAGYAESSIIDNCYTTGRVEGKACVAGVVGAFASGEITNSYSEANVFVSDNGGANAGGLLGSAETDTLIKNCYSTGEVIGGINAFNIGGLAGVSKGILQNSYSTGNVTGGTCIGGLVALASGTIENCYASGNVSLNGIKSTSSLALAGGIAGCVSSSTTTASIKNCNATGFITSSMGDSYKLFKLASALSTSGNILSDANISNCLYNETDNQNMEICSNNISSVNNYDIKLLDTEKNLNLQIGINCEDTSSTNLQIGIKLGGLFSLRDLGLTNSNFLTKIDNLLNNLSIKQIEYGAATNRLESALDEITIQYENLASSRSTIKDADMAELSSTYIQQQILQQASATLLSTTKNIQYQNVLGLLQSLRG